jgi:TRAP-type C4-dicarboxylate transport system permease small subunit
LFVPRWFLYLSVPVSMALMTFHQGQLFVELWRRPADEVKRVAQPETASMAEAEAEAASA